MSKVCKTLMPFIESRRSKISYPTGNKNFAVQQAFPSAFDELETDPFLMCDEFGPVKSSGLMQDPDQFPIGWHPHRGMDIVTYLKKGVGRHGDSLGNRESFTAPGMQWISVGSGIEHAEGGGTPYGEIDHGFQIWVNVPKQYKMDDPRYGTETIDKIPILEETGYKASVVAGEVGSVTGPFRTVQSVQIVDVTVNPDGVYDQEIPSHMETCILYCYDGQGKVGDLAVKKGDTIKLDGSKPDARLVSISGGESSVSIMIFAGKRINEPISWRGPIVMNTPEEVQLALNEYRSGTFLKKRAPWDFKDSSAFPKK